MKWHCLLWVIRVLVSSSLFLFKATRETSFIHAISSVGVMYTIPRTVAWVTLKTVAVMSQKMVKQVSCAL